MEFNNIHLPPFVVAGLYKHTLVVLENDIAVGKWASETVGVGQLEDTGETITTKIVPTENIVTPPQVTKAPVIDVVTQPAKVDVQPKFAPEQAAVKQRPEVKTQPIVDTKKLPIRFLGEFGKKISIVLEDHFHLHINDNDLAFLSKLLQACQLSLSDVAIINVVSNRVNAHQLWQLMPAEKMIIFDVDPGTLGLPFRLSHFKLQPWSDCVFLASPSLEALQASSSEQVVQLKRNLWESLKKMFLA